MSWEPDCPLCGKVYPACPHARDLVNAYAAETRALERVAELEARIDELRDELEAEVDELKARAAQPERHYTASGDTRHTTLLIHFDGDAQTYFWGNYLGTVALDEAKARALELWPDAKFSVEA